MDCRRLLCLALLLFASPVAALPLLRWDFSANYFSNDGGGRLEGWIILDPATGQAVTWSIDSGMGLMPPTFPPSTSIIPGATYNPSNGTLGGPFIGGGIPILASADHSSGRLLFMQVGNEDAFTVDEIWEEGDVVHLLRGTEFLSGGSRGYDNVVGRPTVLKRVPLPSSLCLVLIGLVGLAPVLKRVHSTVTLGARSPSRQT